VQKATSGRRVSDGVGELAKMAHARSPRVEHLSLLLRAIEHRDFVPAVAT